MQLSYRNWRPTHLGRWVNRLMGWWSGLGLPPRFQAALEVHGRTSGLRRSNPVVITTVEGKRYLVLLDPFGPQLDARMYRTGDMVRSLPDGHLEFLGRTDSQVKLCGHRIELDEIVMAVNRCPQVRSSAIAVRGDSSGAKQIVAYVVVDVSASLREPDLRDFLRQQLPDYMQPSVFVRLEALPLNANGKVDRSALPEVTDENIWREQAAVLPETPLEERLTAIVGSLLGMNRVSTHDNFFALGGNSLLGTQMLTRIWEELGIELPLRTLFDHPTVVDLAKKIERLQPSIMSWRKPAAPGPHSQELQAGNQ